MTETLKPFYENVQAHYDLSDEFFALFLDPSRTYSCAYFRDEDMTLEQAQVAKVDLSLSKCDLQPGQKILDIGCGWGTAAISAAENYDVDAIGITLSENQHAYASSRAVNSERKVEFRLQGWEEFTEPVDRIVSIGAFEHFRKERHAEFFQKCRELLPDDGTMLLHTIVLNSLPTLKELGVEVGAEDIAFAKFMIKEIFPGGQLCAPERIERFAADSGFSVAHVEPLRLHYARTLDIWAENLNNAKSEAIELTSPEVFDRYMKYLTGCADSFRKGFIDVIQFKLRCV